MAQLCDPDIDMIKLFGSEFPEPSIRYMVYHYYKSNGLEHSEAEEAASYYINLQDEICQAALIA